MSSNSSRSNPDKPLSPPLWTRSDLSLDLWSDLHPARKAPSTDICREEGYWSTTDRHRLYWQSWYDESKDDRRGTIALMHGYGEHSARYDHLATALVRAGYHVMAIDARGHGRSTGRRGYVERFSRYVDDLSELKRRLRDRWPDLPLFIFGHSNGGLIALRYALRKPDGVSGFIISSPLCGLAMPVPAIKKAMGRLTSRILPRIALPSGLSADMVSCLPEVIESYHSDPLIFDTANARWFTESNQAMSNLHHRAPDLDQPFLFLVAGSDRIVDPTITESIFHRLGSFDRELEVYPDLNHEIFNEPPWRTILQRTILWMERFRHAARH